MAVPKSKAGQPQAGDTMLPPNMWNGGDPRSLRIGSRVELAGVQYRVAGVEASVGPTWNVRTCHLVGPNVERWLTVHRFGGVLMVVVDQVLPQGTVVRAGRNPIEYRGVTYRYQQYSEYQVTVTGTSPTPPGRVRSHGYTDNTGRYLTFCEFSDGSTKTFYGRVVRYGELKLLRSRA